MNIRKDTAIRPRGGMLRMRRSRGAATGFLLILLGMWGALIPFVGPYFNFAYTPDAAWTWTDARGWLEVLPGAVAVLGGLLVLSSRNRATAMLGGWLAVIAGAWFVVGPVFSSVDKIGTAGAPIAGTELKTSVLELAYFSGLGAIIAILGGIAVGRVSVRSVRDIEDVAYAPRPIDPRPIEQPAQPAAQPAPRTEHRSWRHLFSRRTPIPH